MKSELKIAPKPCNYCGQFISWDKRINNKFPVHVDSSGIIIGDGNCPKFQNRVLAPNSIKSVNSIQLFKVKEFNRFIMKNDKEKASLPIFKSKIPLIPRFYVGKIILDLKVFKKIIKIPLIFNKFNEYGLAHGLVRKLLEQKQTFSFFKIIRLDDSEECFIHLFVIPSVKFVLEEGDEFIIEVLDKATSGVKFTKKFIVNKDYIEEIITVGNISKYESNLKHFFGALTYPLKYKMTDGEYIYTMHHDLIGNILYFYVDVDAVFFIKGAPATEEDKGKFIFGELKDKNKKYLLIDITSSNVSTHLESEEYREFIEYSQMVFESKGYSRKKDETHDWTIKDYWEKINNIEIPADDLITIVRGYNEKKLFFPLSRLFKNEKKDVPREDRFMAIQNAKKELYNASKIKKDLIASYSPSIAIVLSEQLVPKFFDLMSFPLYIEFAEGKTIQIKRNEANPYLLDRIPQELLKSKSNQYHPIAGKFQFIIIPIIPKDISPIEDQNVQNLLNDIAYNLKTYKLANMVQFGKSIYYDFNRDVIRQKKQNIWGVIFENQIAPNLLAIDKDIRSKEIIAVPLIGLRELGTSSKLFKDYLQNEFYRLLKTDLSKNHFGFIQSFLVSEYKKYKGSKLAGMLYKNSLFNIGANCPHSEIAKRIENGILFRFKYPFGTRDISKPLESIEMQAGFDASKALFVEDSKPRGAVVVTLDPYGKQVRSKYIRDAHTHKGLISETVIRDLIIEIINHQDLMIEKGLKIQKELPKKIIFLFDGDISNKQKILFVKVYKELIESGELPILPDFYIFEVLKSHPNRLYLLENSKIYDMPFGVLALLNDREFLIKSHIWSKKSMSQPQLYRFKMCLSQRFKGNEKYTILDLELINIGLQLFQSTLFNTGKSGRPLKESFVIHESHKLSQEFATKSDSIGVLFYKD